MSDQPVAIVTGGSRGIGRGIAIRLAADGYLVGVNYAHRADAARDCVRQIINTGGQAVDIQANVAIADERERLIQEAAKVGNGRLDVLVNNAGITSPGRLDVLEATEESFDEVFATNLKGPFFLSQLAARQMIALRQTGRISRGTIINISSISAYAASTNRADYCMAKAALQMMTAVLATRLAEHEIGVFEICPGVIESDMTAPVREKYDRLIAEGLSPIRRWGTPDDVARAVSAIVGGAFLFSTGDRFNVDGGFHLRRL
jgi:NAD(P)-dependent dehydrogenase (short-subunit alcohol dehydrogenase family)